MTPIFHTNKSLRSILTLEPRNSSLPDDKKRKDYEPSSLFDCAEDLGLSKIVVIDDTPVAFLSLFNKCPKENQQLIYGLRVIICNDIRDKEKESIGTHAAYNILCKNGDGWKTLSKIYSFSATTGFYKINKLESYRRIDWINLKRFWTDDLILVPCFYDGFICQNLFTFSEHVPDFSFTTPIFEIQYHGLIQDDLLESQTREYCEKRSFPTWETHSIYYRKYNEVKAFMNYKVIINHRPGRKTNFSAPELRGFNSNDFCVEHLVGKITNDSFLDQFEDYSKSLTFPGVVLPEIKGGYESSREYLKALCRQAWIDRKINDYPNKDIYAQRVKNELAVLEKFGFSTYLLMVYEMLAWCRQNKVPHGWGRGSVAGSVVSWLIGITKADPVKYGLIFERFLNEGRIKQAEINGVIYTDGGSLPDIDTDFSYLNRPRLVEQYIDVQYKDRTSKILTINTLTSKLCLKETGKNYGEYNEDEMNQVTSRVDVLFGKPTPLTDFKEEKEGISQFVLNWLKENPEVFEIALKLENLCKNYGAHAAGYVISKDPLVDTMPFQLSEDDKIISAYDMDDALSLAQKLDLLGLRTLDVIYKTADDVGINIDEVDWEDPFIYEKLQNLEAPYGLFQIEAGLGYETVKKVKPENFEDLGAILALARPGSMNFVDKYAKFRETRNVEPYDEYLDDYLEDTGGVLLYQEQLIKIVNKLFGLSLVDADGLRKIVGKKLPEKLAKYQEKIKEGMKQKNIPQETFDKFWRIVEASANYSFNKCLGEETVVETDEGFKCLFEIEVGDFVLAYDAENDIDHYVEVSDVIHGEAIIYEIELEDGSQLKCSLDHKFMTCDKKMTPLREILRRGLEIVCK